MGQVKGLDNLRVNCNFLKVKRSLQFERIYIVPVNIFIKLNFLKVKRLSNDGLLL
jgi:hypothetical protein